MKIMCSLMDVKAQLFHAPFLVTTLGVAYRNLSDEIARGGEGNVLSSHPEDFDLYTLGIFDEEKGELAVERVRVCNVASLRGDK